MQCKDIPDQEFLDAVLVVNALHNRHTASLWDVQAVLSGYPELIGTNSYTWNYDQLLPWKLVLAKARKLCLKGKLDGCFCGCRGDFEVIKEPPPIYLVTEGDKTDAVVFNLLELGRRRQAIEGVKNGRTDQ